MTEASIFPSYAQYQSRSQSGQTSETNKDNLLIFKMATIEHLPLELIDNPIAEEPSIFKNLDETDILNCSVALAGTRFEQYVTQKFLKPQLKIFASLPSLNESLRNEGWFEDCQETKLILRLFKQYKPILPSMYHFFQNSSWENCANFQKIFQTHNKYLFPL